MEVEEALSGLESLRSDLNAQFQDGVGLGPRLEQLNAHLNTVTMCVTHLFDEAERHQDLVDRIKADPLNLIEKHGHQVPGGLEGRL